ncbi:MAG: hypothetical protein ABUT20_25825 [Bacteroidota bacterium]
MKTFLFIVILNLSAFVNSCSKSIDKLNEGAVELTLHSCKNGIISNDDLQLCFEAVVSDSRCPANAVCIWQGTAVARFSFTKNKDTHTFNLATINMAPAYHKDTTIAGYKIEFINLLPYPGTYTAPAPDHQIKAELKITKQ